MQTLSIPRVDLVDLGRVHRQDGRRQPVRHFQKVFVEYRVESTTALPPPPRRGKNPMQPPELTVDAFELE